MCKGCGKQRKDTDFYRMRFPRHIAETALGLYTDGLSLKKVRRRIRKIYRIVIKSNQTVLNWLHKFGKKPTNAIKNLANRLYGDETKVKAYKKGLFFWFWAMRCEGSEPIGWHVSLGRDITVLGHDVKHEKMKSFKHGNNAIENFFRCKKDFSRFRNLESASRFINHWVWENFGDDSFLAVLHHTFIGYIGYNRLYQYMYLFS